MITDGLAVGVICLYNPSHENQEKMQQAQKTKKDVSETCMAELSLWG